MAQYPNVQLLIDGKWGPASDGQTLPIMDPGTGEELGRLARAGQADLECVVAAARRGFEKWRRVSPMERGKVLRKAADLVRERVDRIATILTMEQGKPVDQARQEVSGCIEIFEWAAEEARRTYGRVIPSRAENVSSLVVKEPIGVVAGFSPWNFPTSQAARKIAAALATGCAIIVKGPEETPASCAALVACVAEAGVVEGALNLVYGIPAEISEFLVPHPVIRKVSFTGSTSVGKHLAAMAGAHMKPVTMELGGHAPVIVMGDADVDNAAKLLATSKYRNAGQICISPTRILVQKPAYDQFVEKFLAHARQLKVGYGLDAGVTMGPLANPRRVEAMENLLADLREKGAEIALGGQRIGNKGNYFEPTVVLNAPTHAVAMNQEPFGPIAMLNPFGSLDEALEEANRLPYGLAAYAYTSSMKNAQTIAGGIEAGMISINHHGLGLAETPVGGVKDSGHGIEGGLEGMEGYLVTKFVTLAAI